MCVAALDTGAFTTCCAQSFGRLRRHGLIALADNGTQGEWQRFEHELPNGLWQMDFKGCFETAAGRCSPLTLLDDHSRFALATTACSKTDAATSKCCCGGSSSAMGCASALGLTQRPGPPEFPGCLADPPGRAQQPQQSVPSADQRKDRALSPLLESRGAARADLRQPGPGAGGDAALA